MKVIRFTNEFGFSATVPLKVIAEHRARHYVETYQQTTFDDEVSFVMDDDYAGIDWLQNNMHTHEFIDHVTIEREERAIPLADKLQACDLGIGVSK